jgi:parallel beta-helix repeat protein
MSPVVPAIKVKNVWQVVFLEKKALMAALLVLVFSAVYGAETNLPASIEKNQDWVPARSPYIIDGTVVIENTSFVTIYPGAVIKFKEGAKLIVKGALYSKGDPKNPVRFLPYNGESFYDGIIFQSKYKNTIEFSIMIRGAIVSEGTPIDVSNCYILNSTGILLKVLAAADIRSNYFYNNTYGIYVEDKNAKFTATGNTFNRNRFAVYLKEIQKDGAVITGNNFFESKVHVTNYTPDNVSAKDNYWDLTEEADIAKLIYDKKSNPRVGEVVFKPFARAKLAVFEPPDAFISLVKIYLSLKRPDEEPARVAFGAGADFFTPMSPAWIKKEASFGMGMRAEFTFNITGAIMAGVEGELLNMTNSDKSVYDYQLNISEFMATGYGYLGYKKDVFFVPFVKIGAGVGLISEQYKSVFPMFNGQTSEKYNEINLAAEAGMGAEFFVTRFFSLKAEAMYNTVLSKRGATMFPLFNLTGSFYFDTPFYLNEK